MKTPTAKGDRASDETKPKARARRRSKGPVVRRGPRPIGAETEVKILDVAIPLFAKHGYEGVAVRDIATAAGLTATTLYLYHQDKRALYVACCVRAFTLITHKVLEAASAGGSDAYKIHRFIYALSRGLIEHENSTRLYQRELIEASSDELAVLVTQVFHEPFEIIVGLIERATGEERPFERASAMMGLLLALIQFSHIRESVGDKVLRFNHEPDRLAAYVLNMTLPSIDWASVARDVELQA